MTLFLSVSYPSVSLSLYLEMSLALAASSGLASVVVEAGGVEEGRGKLRLLEKGTAGLRGDLEVTSDTEEETLVLVVLTVDSLVFDLKLTRTN